MTDTDQKREMKTTPFDVAEYLDSEGVIAEYLIAALESGDRNHFLNALQDAIGIPLETLAALKAGTWKAVPVSPTDEMARPLTRSWLLAEQEPTAEDMHLARQYAALTLAAAPAKPENEK